MGAPQNVGLPPDLHLAGGYTIEFTALDPTAGTDVTAVKISQATLTIDNINPTAGGGEPVLVPVAPLWVPLPLEAQ